MGESGQKMLVFLAPVEVVVTADDGVETKLTLLEGLEAPDTPETRAALEVRPAQCLPGGVHSCLWGGGGCLGGGEAWRSPRVPPPRVPDPQIFERPLPGLGGRSLPQALRDAVKAYHVSRGSVWCR